MSVNADRRPSEVVSGNLASAVPSAMATLNPRPRNGMDRGRLHPDGRQWRAMIVEDDPDIREVLEEMIDAGGHAVVTATNGAEGLAALAQVDPPALVLLDLMMPVMSGFAFLEELARRNDRTGDRVLLISANETVERAAQLPGVVGYVKKPFDLDEVLALVEKYLE